MSQRHAGERIGDFELVRSLGAGGFGEVWEARTSSVRLAIKFLTLDSREALIRFDAEAEALRRISHPNCVRLHGAGTTSDGSRYLTMDFVDGDTLSRWLKTPRTLAELRNVSVQLINAMAAIHAAGILHRDLKPANIMVTRRGDAWHVVLLDFGISKLAGRESEDVTKTGALIGTPGFMSPEQVRGRKNLTAATDLYSLGCVLFQMFEGRPPFHGKTPMEVAMTQLSQAPPQPQQAPRELARLIVALLDADPRRRPPPAILLGALEPRMRTTVGLRREDTPRRTAVIGGIAVGAAALAAVVAWSMIDDPEPAPVVRTIPVSATRLTQSAEPAPAPAQLEKPRQFAEGCELLDDYSTGYRTIGNTAVWLPEDYDRSKRHAVIVLFHDAYSSNDAVINGLDPAVLRAHPESYVIVAPQGDDFLTPNNHWMRRDLTDRVAADLEFTMSSLCVSKTRRFVIGRGRGVRGALRYGCFNKAAAAVGTYGFLAKNYQEFMCMHRPNMPLISMMPNNEPFSPADGKRGCTGVTQFSIKEQLRLLTQARNCDGEPVVEEAEGGTCATHSCPTPFVTCNVDGDSRWSNPAAVEGLPTVSRRTTHGCFAERPNFDETRRFLEFFDSVSEQQKQRD